MDIPHPGPGLIRATRSLLSALLLSTLPLATAAAYDVSPGSSGNVLRLQIDDRVGLTERASFTATVADAPSWILSGEPRVLPGRVLEIVLPFDVTGEVTGTEVGSRGVLSLRVRASSPEGVLLLDRIHRIDLTLTSVTPPVQRGFTIDECCLAASSVNDPSLDPAGPDPTNPDLAGPRLLGSHPNPVAGLANIVFALSEDGEARLRIFDVQGRRIRELTTPRLGAGYHRIAWDTKDEAGNELVPGVYFYDLTVGEWSETRKLEILR